MSGKRQLTGRRAVMECTEHLERESWCVDFSGKPAALHTRSNRAVSPDALPYKFWDWVSLNNVEISDDDEVLKNLSSAIFARLPRIYGSSFRPVDEKFIEVDGLRVANTYSPFKPEAREDSVGATLVEELFQRLFPDATERTLVRQYLAHVVQRPLERPQWGLLITGVGGTGKSRLVELAEAALGQRHRWRENSYKPIDRQFSEVLPDNLLVTFDDAAPSAQTYESLKHAITKSFQEVEIKGQQKKISREVYARIIIISNSEDPLPGIADDRRFFAPARCIHPVDRDESEKFFAKFNDWFKQPGVPAFLFHYFRGVDLAGFNPNKTIRTPTLLRMEGISDPAQLRDAVHEVAEELEIFLHVEVVAQLKRRGIQANTRELSKVLSDIGFVQRRRTHPSRRHKRQVTLWCSSSVGRTASLTDAQRERIAKLLPG